MQRRVSIIGDGAMATTCAIMLAENGHAVRLWSAFEQQAADLARTRRNERFLPEAVLPATVEVTADDAAAMAEADWVLSAVPTQYIRGVWERLRPHAPAGVAICSVAKGIERKTLLRPTQIIADVLGDGHPLAALSGPSIAPEIIRHCPATVVSASADEALAEALQQDITRPYFRVYTNADILGVELAGATKNVIAIAAGILDGLELGDNAKAALVTRGLAEITRLGLHLGARPETFAGLAGVGDLITTCISPVGRNRSLGEAVGRGRPVEQALAATQSVVEGVATTESVTALARREAVEMPITEGIHAVLFEGARPREAIRELMTRPLKAE
jgi:glycerol-3-phosphate dehydrogenase (NAD(P)+)